MTDTKGQGYAGIDKDKDGGMTPVGTIIRDAWVFDIIPEDETCAGWSPGQLQNLYDQVYEAWKPYGHLAGKLPPELAERHRRIHEAALQRARELGWDPELGDDD